MSMQAKMLKNLFIRGKINKAGLRKAVVDGVINADEYRTITGEDYE